MRSAAEYARVVNIVVASEVVLRKAEGEYAREAEREREKRKLRSLDCVSPISFYTSADVPHFCRDPSRL